MKEEVDKTKQHFVPRFYLDSFAYFEGKRKPHIYVYDKKRRYHFSDAIDNIGYEKDMYTLKGVKNIYAWDDLYTNIEPDMAAIIRKTIQTAENILLVGEKKVITEDMKRQFAAFIAIQLARGKKYIGFSRSKRKEIKALITEYGFTGIWDDFPQKDDLAALSTSSKLLSLYALYFHNRSWVFYYSRQESFITSDEPVIMFDAHLGKQGLFKCGLNNPNTIVCFPLSPHVLLTMYHPFFDKGKQNVLDCKIINLNQCMNHINIEIKHNMGQIAQCSRFIYGKSEKVIKDILLHFK